MYLVKSSSRERLFIGEKQSLIRFFKLLLLAVLMMMSSNDDDNVRVKSADDGRSFEGSSL